jgi:hypothetical protein
MERADDTQMVRRRLFWVAAVFFGVIVLLILLAKLVLPGVIKSRLVDEVNDSCADCRLAIKSVDVSILNPGELAFHDIRFIQGQAERALVEARIEKLVVDVAISKSSKENVIIDRVEGFKPDIVYADGDAPEKKVLEKSSGKKLLFEIRNTRLSDGEFKYAHTKRKKTSFLHVHKIDASMSAVGNTPEVRERMTTAKLTGQIEKSGHAQLDLAALVRRGPWYVDGVLEVSEQNIADLNTFFTPNDRIELKGTMKHAVAKLNVRDEKTKSNVLAIYHDADYKEHPSEDRSPIEAGLANIGSSIMMTKTNVDFPPEQQQAEIEVKQDPDEPLVHYMLRSAKLGMLEVAKKKKK